MSIDTPNKGGRPPTGSPKWSAKRGVWELRPYRPDGSRPIVTIPGLGEHEVERARAVAKIIARRVQLGEAVPVGEPETVTEWFGRWASHREAKGLRCVRQDRGRFTKWIAPHIGARPMANVSRRELEQLVAALDASVLKGELAWKTAIHVWSVTTKMFSDACRSKLLELRVREDNPAREIQAPDRGPEKQGPYLFPREFDAIMRCGRVPDRWKRLIALSVFLYLRRGELAALEWGSVNLEQGYVHVHRAEDESGEIKPTKTDDNRRVPIEPALVPLLETMKKTATTARVIAMPPREDLAKRLRKYVAWSCEDRGIPVRSELLANDETRRQLTWHDLRHTGITWRAVRGDAPKKIQRGAGHSSQSTTDGYINEAEVFDLEAFGDVFGPLPVTLMGPEMPPDVSDRVSDISDTDRPRMHTKHRENRRPQGESNPR